MIFKNFIAKSWFSPIFVKTRNFPAGGTLWRHNFATPRPIFMILVCMNRRDPYLYYDTKQPYFRGLDFKIIGGGGCNHPLG